MALGDREHVEAVAIMRRLRDEHAECFAAGDELDSIKAADVWLRENHPEPRVYVAAMHDSLAPRSKGTSS